MTKSASFDVLGTCFHFDPAIETIAQRLNSYLSTTTSSSSSANNIAAKALFFGWFFAAQRDFTYTSMTDNYTPIAQILKHTFKRACWVAGITDVSDDDVAAVMAQIVKLPAVPGLKTCFDGLRDAGWDVYGVTNGGKQASLKYFELADIRLDADHLLSCDDVQTAKPQAKVYETANEHLTAKGLGQQGDGERWFVAAHAWDLMAARKAGFKTAYLDHEEGDPATAVFGEFDLYASSMEELLEKMKKV